MATKSPGWIADQLQRWQAIYTAWLYIKPFLLPLVTAFASAFAIARTHVQPWQVLLIGIYGFAGGLLILGGLRVAFGIRFARRTSRSGKLVIHSVQYGIEGQYKDIKTALEGHVKNNQIDIPVTTLALTNDPFPHQLKTVIVHYSVGDGATERIVRHDGDRLEIPSDDASATEPTPANDDTRRVRLLEYHAMHMTWLRFALLDPNTSTKLVNDVPRVIQKHRDALLDLTPSVFPQSFAVAFAPPAVVMLTPARKLVEGLPDPEQRASHLATVDALLGAINRQWKVLDGFKAPRP